MDNINYYFLQFASNDPKLNIEWDDLQIDTTANLLIGDILTLEKESFTEQLISDFGTIMFVIRKRVFKFDNGFENVGGVFRLYIEPLQPVGKPHLFSSYSKYLIPEE